MKVKYYKNHSFRKNQLIFEDSEENYVKNIKVTVIFIKSI